MNHTKFCFACSQSIDARAEICPKCGVRQTNPPIVGEKNKLVAALLAFFLGGFGIHKFYLGRIGQGFLYLLFCWTFLPAFVAFIEGIIYLCSSDEQFARKYE
ncbi:TM2 domain-containing protein [Acinetobacter nectaris]|uniref:TM2 domain-containing protein n=1 Tax=Acinetobacter nectaris TaxID=1219382 RepID=UPI001F2E088E|nr:TM2 domain-containing protein [Acinetobacter nectaris]MCF9046044.1 TM2 domain-containing protein [Acinetobacter nectaris]